MTIILEEKNTAKFILAGDQVIYSQNSGHEIEFNGQKYYILPHSAVQMLIRDEGLMI